MSWKRSFKAVPNHYQVQQWLGSNSQNHSGVMTNNSSFLPEVYAGPPNRIERYREYENMDRGNTTVSQSLDTIAEFCTQKESGSKEYFEFEFLDDVSESEVEVLKSSLTKWSKMNQLNKRLFRMVRNTLQYGDQFFVRDPQTFKWLWVDHYNVEKITVNEAEGKEVESYHILNPDLNLQTLNISPSRQPNTSFGYPSNMVAPAQGPTGVSTPLQGTNTSALEVDATHVIHLSLSDGLDTNWPFGNSILENIYKQYKQIALLEDAILIYRIHRAPERRVFYIDTGNLPPNKQMAHLERTKNEINQKKIPTRNGEGSNILDSTYNPMSMREDFFFPQNADGRGSRVETLAGGENLGQINDLNYFNDQLKKGLNVPKSYIYAGSEDDTGTYSDGRATTALISEFRFSNYCERLQALINDVFDREFKLYLKNLGVNVQANVYRIVLNTPQNFAKYRQMELDNAMISTWSSIADTPYISKRFAMERYLGMTKDEIIENEKMLKEENPELNNSEMDTNSSNDLRSLGVRPPNDDFGDDFDDMDFEDDFSDEESVISGAENTEPDDAPPPPPP